MILGTAGRLPDGFRVAIVGAGVAGLSCGSALQARGARVVVFEASRRPGGRLATESTPAGSFDTGAQYFTAQDFGFQRMAAEWRAAGLVAPWDAPVIAVEGDAARDTPASVVRYIATDGMQAIGRRLAADLDVRLDVTIAAATRRGTSWLLFDAQDVCLSHGGYDAVVVAVPDAGPLLAAAPELARQGRRVVWQPCWAVLLAIEPASGFEFGGAFVNDHPALAWVTREDSKRTPTSGLGERWVLHATPRWSALHLNHPADDVASLLARAFAGRFNFSFRSTFITARRWLAAAPANPLKPPCLWDPELMIGAVGDWCGGPRVEGAFLSGRALGERIDA